MMKFNTKLAIALVAATTSVFGLASGAMAGEGGAAGAAAFTITPGTGAAGQVTGVAVAAAIGKNDASAYAYNNGAANTAGALGSGGFITLTNPTGGGFTLLGSVDATPTSLQNNTLTDLTSITIGITSSDKIVNLP